MFNEIMALTPLNSSLHRELSRHFPLLIQEEANEMVKGKIVVTEKRELTPLLYELGAKAVYAGTDTEKISVELKKNLQVKVNIKDIKELLHTQDMSYLYEVEKCLQFASNSHLPLLLLGESGSGKTQFARALHSLLRPHTPFVALNLLELSSGTLESALFGHKKGAFTGAINDREGILAQANGGTLFLDEIGALSLELQRKLLKVIEEKSFYPIGSSAPIKVDFHLISATCQNIEEEIKNGNFRQDFYYRLKGHTQRLRPLRERSDDIPLLLQSFQKAYGRQLYFTQEALNSLIEYSWPGNIRELNHLYHKLQCKDEAIVHELILERPSPTCPQKPLPELINDFELEVFKKVFEEQEGRPNRVCAALGISKSVFYRLRDQQLQSSLKLADSN